MIGLMLAALEMVPPRIVGGLVTSISQPSFSFAQVGKAAALWAAVALLIQLIHGLQIYLANYCGEILISRFREEIFAKVQSLSMRFFTHNQTGRILSCLGNDLDAL